MIIMFVQSDKYNPKGLLKKKIAQCEPGFSLNENANSFFATRCRFWSGKIAVTGETAILPLLEW